MMGSTLVASAANFATFTRVRSTARRLVEAQRIATGKKERIMGPLIEGLQDLLRREVDKIRATSELLSKIEALQDRPVVFHVQVEIDGLFRVIASTADDHSNVRRQALEPNEGILGYAVGNKFSYVIGCKDSRDNWRVFEQSLTEEIGQQGTLRRANENRTDRDLKWITVTPIYDGPMSAPWSDRVNGALSVSAYHEAAKELFSDRHFQRHVESTRHSVEHFVEAFVALRDIDSFH